MLSLAGERVKVCGWGVGARGEKRPARPLPALGPGLPSSPPSSPPHRGVAWSTRCDQKLWRRRGSSPRPREVFVWRKPWSGKSCRSYFANHALIPLSYTPKHEMVPKSTHRAKATNRPGTGRGTTCTSLADTGGVHTPTLTRQQQHAAFWHPSLPPHPCGHSPPTVEPAPPLSSSSTPPSPFHPPLSTPS